VEWNNSRILRDVAKDVAALQKSDGGNILVYGSAPLVKALLHHDLIDELRLMVHPLSIGGGLRLFDDNRELKKFGLKHSRAIDNGVLILEYQPKLTRNAGRSVNRISLCGHFQPSTDRWGFIASVFLLLSQPAARIYNAAATLPAEQLFKWSPRIQRDLVRRTVRSTQGNRNNVIGLASGNVLFNNQPLARDTQPVLVFVRNDGELVSGYCDVSW
jgi:hypothetical protein